ncbi:MAG: hypothetical protein ACI3W5_10650 [Faecousia sp.]
MGELREERRSHFFTWLSRSVSPAQLSELYQAFSDLEDILVSHRYYHRLSCPLSETTDAAAVDTLYDDLCANRQFMRSNRSGVKLSLLRHYAHFCREQNIESVSAQWKEETSSGDSLIDRLKKDRISYVDNRPKNGALWFAQTSGTDALIKDFKARGMQFSFSPTKQQWWTRDSSPTSIPKKEDVDPSTIKANQQAFIAWLKRQDYDAVDQLSIYGTTRKIHTMLLSDGTAEGLFGIQNFELVRSCAIAVRKKNKFLLGNRNERGLWTQSLDCYLHFAEEGLVPATQIPTAEEPISERIEPTIPEPEGKQVTVELLRQEKQISALTSAEGFRVWLAERNPQENADSIIAAVSASEQFAQRTHMRGNKLFGIAPSGVKAYVNHLIVSRAFANADPHGYREFKYAAPLLMEYAGSISVPELVTPAVQEPVGAPTPASPETKAETVTDMEPALADMLQDEQFTDLRKALYDRGIRTLDDFKRLNLWVFMNQNGLYSIGQRQTVYSAIRRILESGSSVEIQTQWKLVTSQNEYTGTSPAEAFMAYCRVMATKYPLRFRNLIGMRMTGTDLVPLMNRSIHENDPCLGYPKAYINSEIDADKANLFARWIATSCRDGDEPNSVICIAPASKSEAVASDNPAHTRVVEPTSAQTRKEVTVSLDAFRTFLIDAQHLAERTAGNYWTSIRMIEEYIEHNHLDYSLVNSNADQAQQIFDLLMSRRDFVRINDERHHQYSAALYQFILFLRQEGVVLSSGNPTQANSPIELSKPPKSEEPSPLQKQVEKLVLDTDLDGLTLDKLYMQIPNVTMVALKHVRDASPNLVDMGCKLIHVDAFVDWDEAAEKLHEILEKLFTKNNGYVSNTQLWDYAKAEMHMFLNDNGISDMWGLYYIARHMFEKTHWNDVNYAFSSNGHISRPGEKVLSSTLDVIRKYAQENHGFFRYNDLVEYLESVGIKTGNLRGQMRIGAQPIFFYYNDEEIISAESMEINEAWLDQVEQALNRLFADAGDHIVLRAINPIWFEQLPTLPGYRPWTQLLLQYVLMFYGKRLGAKTIGSELNQNYSQLHAMLVTQDSVVQTFADAVVAYLVDNEIEQRQFEAEELRSLLVKGGMIIGNELIWHVPKAIGSDPRFAWDMSGQNVKVQV